MCEYVLYLLFIIELLHFNAICLFFCAGGMGGCGGCSNSSSDGDEEKSSVEEEEDDETTMVMTCEGHISDPQLKDKLNCLMNRLQSLSNSGQLLCPVTKDHNIKYPSLISQFGQIFNLNINFVWVYPYLENEFEINVFRDTWLVGTDFLSMDIGRYKFSA